MDSLYFCLSASPPGGFAAPARGGAHEPDDLLTPEIRQKVAKGAGLSDDEVHALLETNPQQLLAKLGFPAAHAA